jgi:hypothetical protein
MKHEGRSENRIRSKGSVTLLAGGTGRLPAEVYDVSEFGISLLVEPAIDLGVRVEIDAGHLTASGVVVDCTPQGARHEVGIEFDSPDSA